MDSLQHLPVSVQGIFAFFWPCFTDPSLANFARFAIGWALLRGRHNVSNVLRATSVTWTPKQHAALHRFLSRAVWCVEQVGLFVAALFLPFLPAGQVVVIVDDTLVRKSGPHVWGAAMHHDPLASTYSGGGRPAHKAFAFGHNFVVLAMWVPLPWNPARGVAIPVLIRLYRGKKRCPSTEYAKRTEMAAELVERFRAWLEHASPAHQILVVGDGEYACSTLVRSLPMDIDFSGPAVMNAALYELPAPRPSGQRGAPPKKGNRLPTPAQLADDARYPWKRVTVTLYGRSVTLLVKTLVCLYYTVAGTRLVRIVLTRDPKGKFDDRAYFTTIVTAKPQEVLAMFARRWTLEVTFRTCKQDLGLEEPQNGWGKREGPAPRKKIPGPQPRGRKGEAAVRRTAPLVMLIYGIVHAWFFTYGDAEACVKEARALAPWNPAKTEPSFADMLAALRREIITADFLADPLLARVMKKFPRERLQSLLAA